MKQLEVFYRGILQSIPGLTDHVVSEGVYLLLGNISLEVSYTFIVLLSMEPLQR